MPSSADTQWLCVLYIIIYGPGTFSYTGIQFGMKPDMFWNKTTIIPYLWSFKDHMLHFFPILFPFDYDIYSMWLLMKYVMRKWDQFGVLYFDKYIWNCFVSSLSSLTASRMACGWNLKFYSLEPLRFFLKKQLDGYNVNSTKEFYKGISRFRLKWDAIFLSNLGPVHMKLQNEANNGPTMIFPDRKMAWGRNWSPTPYSVVLIWIGTLWCFKN